MRILLVVFFMLLSNVQVAEAAFDGRRTIREIEQDFDAMEPLRIAERVDRALDALVRRAVSELRAQHLDMDANAISDDWQNIYQGQLPELIFSQRFGGESIGDYEPLSDWLAYLTLALDAWLGPEVMHLTRLEDIRAINHCIPVVFHMRNILGNVQISEQEYAVHFIPLAGCTTYWGVFIACEVASSGTASLACAPSAMVAEMMVITFVAPPLSPRAYKVFWG